MSFLLLLVTPSICFGSSARYTQLVREKQRKIEELEKCMGTNKGLQIAGISTLGLTAVGVAGNIAEAKIIKDNTKTIEKQNTTLQDKEKEYNRKKQQKAEEEAAEAARVAEYNRTHTLTIIATQDIARINGLAGNPGDSVITRGYEPEELPPSLRSQFADAVIKFMTNCKGHDDNKKSDNIKTTKFGGAWATTNWETYKTITSVSEEEATKKVIPEDYTEKTIVQCLINECNNGFYTPDSKQCIADESDEDEVEGNAITTEPGKNKKVVSTAPVVDKSKEKRAKTSTEQDPCGSEFLKQNNAVKAVYLEAEGGTMECFIQECKSGFHTTLNGKNYSIASKGLDSDVVCTKDTADQINKFKAACESPESGGTWRGTVCDCGPDKVENRKTHKCEDLDDDGVASQKKCKVATLNKLKAKDGIVEGNKCKVTECKGNLVKNETNTICECPSDKPVLNEKTFTCSAKTETTSGLQNASEPIQWTDDKISSNPEGYCSSQFKTEAGKACCLEIHVKKNAYNWDGKGMKCNCIGDLEWKNNKCVGPDKDVPDFSETKADLDKGKKLIGLYAEKNNLNLYCDDGFITKKLDDYLSCKDTDGRKYIFHFDSLTEKTNFSSIIDTICNMYGGKTKRVGSSRQACVGMDLDLCSHMGRSVHKVLPNVSASLHDDGLGQSCVLY